MTITAGALIQWARVQNTVVHPAHARTLLAHLSATSADFLFTHPHHPVDSDVEETFKKNIQAMINGKPLSRLIGEREFWSLSFVLNKETLDPRPDSETLVEGILAHTDKEAPLRILDLGTGTGCLLISLLTELPNATGVGVDISPKALEAAAENTCRHLKKEQAEFCLGPWFDHVEGLFDIILSNPPYIPDGDFKTLDPEVQIYDPKQALVAGAEGIDCYQNIIQQAPKFLKPSGMLAFEIGIHQTHAISELLKSHGFTLKEVRQDLGGIDRCLISFYDRASSF